MSSEETPDSRTAQLAALSGCAAFFFGLFLAPIAGVVLLHKNAKDRGASKAA
jgi:hypothetical protein